MTDMANAKKQEMTDMASAKKQEMTDKANTKKQEMTDMANAKKKERTDKANAKMQQLTGFAMAAFQGTPAPNNSKLDNSGADSDSHADSESDYDADPAAVAADISKVCQLPRAVGWIELGISVGLSSVCHLSIICLSSVYLSVYLSVHLSVYLSVCLSVCLFGRVCHDALLRVHSVATPTVRVSRWSLSFGGHAPHVCSPRNAQCVPAQVDEESMAVLRKLNFQATFKRLATDFNSAFDNMPAVPRPLPPKYKFISIPSLLKEVQNTTNTKTIRLQH
eukprot:1309422-Pyramimonas_sp.AAC.1